jgi:hypothetical protein
VLRRRMTLYAAIPPSESGRLSRREAEDKPLQFAAIEGLTGRLHEHRFA